MVCGPSRDLTRLFNKFREETKNKKNRFGYSLLGGTPPGAAAGGSHDGHQRLLASGTGVVDVEGAEIEMSSLPPIWADLIKDAQDDVKKIEEKLKALQKAQQRRLLKVFSEESKTKKNEIDMITEQVQNLFRRCESRVQQVSSRGIPAEQQTEAEIRMRRNAQRAVASDLQRLTGQYKRIQRDFAAELEKRQGGGDFFSKKTENLVDDDVFTDHQMQELEHWETEVDTRNEEISRIAKSVQELAEIFKEVAVLVIDQGTILDRIDYNIEEAVTQTEQAAVQIQRAEQHQKSGRVMKCITVLIICISVMIVILFMKHASRTTTKTVYVEKTSGSDNGNPSRLRLMVSDLNKEGVRSFNGENVKSFWFNFLPLTGSAPASGVTEALNATEGDLGMYSPQVPSLPSPSSSGTRSDADVLFPPSLFDKEEAGTHLPTSAASFSEARAPQEEARVHEGRGEGFPNDVELLLEGKKMRNSLSLPQTGKNDGQEQKQTEVQMVAR
uniref:t-SNARE coiled-coil homology domain-containing protein n=1 Tax=Chromera velia CCMP2878 TaxID=1169474 RepID=A0A0G4I3Z7_9ALVE|eukprot:Cvel_10755.t1-p1 / transcript=Cvel_10755.t1 / gene=Cvel_10755 / organism=Chromera_velia_CCMP2878 / gene_product=Syntaxin-42, putative / transcript_product=Syntaxin-42, putative / location=Cvel_scaffold656:37239-42837(-) / protein_length=497 / sequence_SO=supercontig / SO=protein_coding / is_pseudo=false